MNELEHPDFDQIPIVGLPEQQAAVTHVVHFDIFTLFPQMFSGPFSESIIRRAQERGIVSISLHNIRYYTTDRHHVCDDTPYGGGGGMSRLLHGWPAGVAASAGRGWTALLPGTIGAVPRPGDEVADELGQRGTVERVERSPAGWSLAIAAHPLTFPRSNG